MSLERPLLLTSIWRKSSDWIIARLSAPLALKYRVLFGVACAAAGALTRAAIDPLVQGAPFITFFPALVAAGVFGSGIGALTCLVVSVLLVQLFWLAPVHTLALTQESLLSLLIFVFMGLIIAALTGIVNAYQTRLRKSEQAALLIASEMRHRVTNQLAIVQAAANATLRDDAGRSAFIGRLQAIARAQEFALAGGGVSDAAKIELRLFLEHSLEPFELAQVVLDGQRTAITHRSANMLGLAIHELATNSLKHGALSCPQGRITLSWSEGDRWIRLVWKESGGPKVSEPERQGFGLTLLRGTFPRKDGKPSLSFDADGITCTMDVSKA
jgi:two-component sensor histidine kinase